MKNMNPVTESLRFDTSFLTGNITPISWYQHIRAKPTKTKPEGSPDFIAVAILADVMHWYMPTEIRDEITGQFIGYKQKFVADKLQKKYQAYADLFGVSRKRVKGSFDLLEKLGLITREFRTVETETEIENGLAVNYVMFIEPNVDNVRKASVFFEKNPPSLLKKEEPIQQLHTKNLKTTTGQPEPIPPSKPKEDPLLFLKKEVAKKNVKIPTMKSVRIDISGIQPDDFTRAMSFVRPNFQRPEVEEMVNQQIQMNGYAETVNAIKYTNDHFTGNQWFAYKKYLSKVFGYEEELSLENDSASEEVFLESRRSMPTDFLIMDAQNGCWASQHVLRERGLEI